MGTRPRAVSGVRRPSFPWLQAVLTPMLLTIARVRVRGREHLPADGPFIVAPNHPSQIDPIYVALALRRRVTFMAKSDLFRGAKALWLSRLGAFPVRRGA